MLLFCLAFIGLLATGAVIPPALAADSPATTPGPDLSRVRAEIKAKQYAAALAELKGLAVNYQNADIYSLLGHALWKTGDPAQGMIYYNKALALDPNHKGALEYQGELFIELGQMDKAQENLTKLNRLCWLGCEERSDLKEAIEHAPGRH
jgi:tetratricopeptide (TPR) repeat protein